MSKPLQGWPVVLPDERVVMVYFYFHKAAHLKDLLDEVEITSVTYLGNPILDELGERELDFIEDDVMEQMSYYREWQ